MTRMPVSVFSGSCAVVAMVCVASALPSPAVTVTVAVPAETGGEGQRATRHAGRHDAWLVGCRRVRQSVVVRILEVWRNVHTARALAHCQRLRRSGPHGHWRMVSERCDHYLGCGVTASGRRDHWLACGPAAATARRQPNRYNQDLENQTCRQRETASTPHFIPFVRAYPYSFPASSRICRPSPNRRRAPSDMVSLRAVSHLLA